MTKAQLIHTLEPFDDDIRIDIIDHNGNRMMNEAIYYQFHNGLDEALIVIAPNYIHIEKGVELKIK